MDLKDQLMNLFPDHEPEKDDQQQNQKPKFWLQDTPIICKYEKRNGRPVTILEGYTGASSDFKELTRTLQSQLSTGGSFKNEKIVIQGDFRDRIMEILGDLGFRTKRVGG